MSVRIPTFKFRIPNCRFPRAQRPQSHSRHYSYLMPRILIGLAASALVVSMSFSRTAATAPASAYLGSEACQRCHQSSYDSWRRTLHVQMTKPIAQALVEGDFGGPSAA